LSGAALQKGARVALSLDHVLVAAGAASSKTVEPTVILDVGDLLGITDHFVITSGTNVRQVRTIAEEVELHVKAHGGGSPRHVEGLDDAHWVLLDYGPFVVHVFLDEARRYYDLERLWADAPRLGPPDEELTVGPAARSRLDSRRSS
jgi:ribosome-associated protein